MKRGGQPGNKNAAKGRTQLDVHISLSGKRRQFFDRFTKIENGAPPTEEEIIKEARKLFYRMVDDAIRQVTREEQGNVSDR